MTLMTEDYNLLFEDWLTFERQKQKENPRGKQFVSDRPYRHLDGRHSLADFESNIPRLIPYLRDPSKMPRYSFLPFIRRDRRFRRFRKKADPMTGSKDIIIDQKNRPIMYASHSDAAVFGFYAYLLKTRHNELLAELELENSVIAYRKVPREDGSKKNKSNIDFANDVYMALQKTTEAAVLCIDIKDFFGSMNHERIETKWAAVLGAKSLPIGHKVVFDNITKYRYIFLYEALEALGLGSFVNGKFKWLLPSKNC